MIKNRSRASTIAVCGVLLALGIIFPFATSHAFGLPGTVLLPMHIPVLFCGFTCGPIVGLCFGLVLPLINSLLTGMPSFYPMLPIMTAELGVYGLISGLLHFNTKFGKSRIGVYLTLLISMISGRIAYGVTYGALLIFNPSLKALSVFGAIASGVLGIIVQILLIPPVVFAVERFMKIERNNAVISAKNLIKRGKATCVVIKDGKIINIELGRGVKPIISMYEQGILENAIVVDKIIGRAAAMVLTLGKVSACYGLTVSKGGVDYLRSQKIEVEWENLTDFIINRKGDGQCPMEETVKDVSDPKEGLELLKRKIEELSKNVG